MIARPESVDLIKYQKILPGNRDEMNMCVFDGGTRPNISR